MKIVNITFFIIFSTFCIFQSEIIYAEKTDSIENLMNSATDKKILIDLHVKLIQTYIENNDSNSLLKSFTLIELAEKYGTQKDIAEAFFLAGKSYYICNKLVKSIESYLISKQYYEETGEQKNLAHVLLELGESYRSIFDYKSAFQNWDNALYIFKKFKDEKNTCITLNRLSSYYIDNFNEKNKIYGYIYAKQSNEIAIKNKFYDQIALNYLLIGSYYSSYDIPKYSLYYYKKSLSYIVKARNKSYESLIMKDIATSYYQMKKFDDALFWAYKALNLSFKNNIITYQWLSADILYKTYAKINQQDSVYKYNSIAFTARLHLFNEELNAQRNKIENQYIKDKYNKELENKRHENNLLVTIMFMSILSASLIFYIIFHRYKKMKDINKKLSEQNEIIENQKKEVIESNEQKEKLFSIIAHDLRSPFNTIIGISDLLIHESNEMPRSEINKLINILYHSSQNYFKLLENLLEWTHLQRKRIQLFPKAFNLASQISETINIHLQLAEFKKIEIISEISTEWFVKADVHLFDVVMRNLLSNAIKISN